MANATNRWLDRLASHDKEHGGTGTDYKLAQLLGVATQQVSKYRRDVDHMSDDTAIQLAELLGVLPVIVVTDVRGDRARTEREKRFWTQLARNAKGGKVAAVILSASLVAAGAVNSANWGEETPSPAAVESAPERCILCKVPRTRRGRRFRRNRRRPVPSFVPGRVRELSYRLAA